MSGKPMGDAPTVTRSLRLTPREWAALDERAKQCGTTTAALLRDSLRGLGLIPEPERKAS